jgi:hypothetical protein
MEKPPVLDEAGISDLRPHHRHSAGLPQLLPALLLVILAVVGNIILIQTGAGGNVTSPRNIATLGQIFSAALWVGVIWLGILLAYRGIIRSRG